MKTFKRILILLLIYSPTLLRAEEQGSVNEDSMFGDTTDTDKSNVSGDDKKLDQEQKEDQHGDNHMQIGGLIYYRLIASPQADRLFKNSPVTLPLQFDGFMDARPNDRIRAFLNARLLYDSSKDANSKSTAGNSFSNLPTAAGSTTASNPRVVLDQAWLKFDIERTLFITAGNQYIKWGTSRFWNPTDFLNVQKRDPLLAYDLRLGTPMLKLELPWESTSTNLYAITLFDKPEPSSTLGQMGQGFRLETVLGVAEIGLDAVYRHNVTPVYGLDISTPLGPVDIYGEVAYLTRVQGQRYNLLSIPSAGDTLENVFNTSNYSGAKVQASGGINYSFAWRSNRQAVIGAEYFYNQIGYRSAAIYPILIFTGNYQPFYLGEHYASIYLTAEGPDAGKHTSYTLSVIGNISDKSLIARLDFAWTFLTYMTFQVYVDGHFGSSAGEFNFSLNTPALSYQGNNIPAVNLPRTALDIGIGLRARF